MKVLYEIDIQGSGLCVESFRAEQKKEVGNVHEYAQGWPNFVVDEDGILRVVRDGTWQFSRYVRLY